GLVFDYLRSRCKSIWTAMLISLLVLLMPVPRVNTMSQTTGAALFFALFRTFDPATTVSRTQRFMLGGLLVAGISSLRMNFIPGVVLILAAFAIREAWTCRKLPWLDNLTAPVSGLAVAVA